MAGRSTRTKLKFQVMKIQKDLDSILKHLQYIDELNQGQSAFINKALPSIVVVVEGVKKMTMLFRQGL